MQKTYMRGCVPSPRHKLAKATWVGHSLKGVTPPANFATICPDYDISGNATYGDCVSAEEGNAKRAYSIAIGQPEIEIPGANVVSWARKHGYLNGANLDDVLTTMETQGMVDKSGVVHCDGNHSAVDYSNQAEMMAAIYTYKTVKIAVAANQLEAVVNGTNGWFLFGAKRDPDCDHCVGLHGYGTAAFLAQLCGVKLPHGVNPNEFCVLLYTWGCVGIVGWASLMAIMEQGEAWVRSPGDTTNTNKENTIESINIQEIQEIIAVLQTVDQLIQEIEKDLTPTVGAKVGANGVLIRELIAAIMAAAKNPAVLAVLAGLAATLPQPYAAIVQAIIASLQAQIPTPAPTPAS